ncbi:branched-chain amino acid ABC transporter permease [Aquamicrobium sp. LC103]|uniref:branched-chain amino acid ABC transporter permease n=1 Tax=Aquamicrobium sp. LC103 TaxID=1120658 RepID=UPI00063E891E|nr:branched-chain amino acid ABC transporter permease [Aquamicrobium sp. LC103]TKT75264.1 branched-chain amino acid ABC transporter permease [Aquamicrobium sp. LC103]
MEQGVGLLAALPVNEVVFFINKVVIAGLIIGSVYALGAVGVTLIYGILRFAHFAHGDMMTAGAFFALIFVALFPTAGDALGLPSAFVLMPLAMVVTALFAIGIDKGFYAPLRAAKVRPVVIVMASIGVMLMMQGLIRLFAGTGTYQFDAGSKAIYRLPVMGRDIILTQPQALLIVFTALAAIALHLFLTRTRMGKAMRAVSDNPDLARVSGISIDSVVRSTWVIAGALAAAGGTLLALDVTLKPDLSFNIILPIFAAAIVGGVGQPYGAMAGGMLVGFTETLAVFNWSVLLRPLRPYLPDIIEIPNRIAFVPTEYKIVVPFFILIAVLIWKPTGIFKGRVLK